MVAQVFFISRGESKMDLRLDLLKFMLINQSSR